MFLIQSHLLQFITISFYQTGDDLKMTTLAQTIMVVSEYTVGLTGDITTDQLSTMSDLTSDIVAFYDPGFTPNQRILFQTYLILNLWECRDGGSGGANITNQVGAAGAAGRAKFSYS